MAAPMMGHASYRVQAAANSAIPTLSDGGPGVRCHSQSHRSASEVVAMSSGSVIGVTCRYRRLGLRLSNAAAVTAPTRDPVVESTKRAAAHVVAAKHAIDTREANAPVR